MTGADRASSTRVRVAAGSLLLASGFALAAVAASQATAGAGSPAPDKTIPTLPPSSGAVDSTVVASSIVDSTLVDSTVVGPPVTETTETTETTEPAPDSTVAQVETGIPLRAGAGPAELFAAATNALLSSNDVATGLGGFAVIPAGIPTPAGATVASIAVSYSADLEHFTAGAELTSSATADDVAAYYQTVLVAEGFTPTVDRTESGVRQLEFERHQTDADEAAVHVSIDGSAGLVVDVEITDHAEPAALQAFAGWPAGLPGLADGRPVETLITATRDGSTTMVMSTTFAYEGITVDELTARIRDGLAGTGGGFRIAEGDEGGPTIILVHTIIDDAVASISDVSGVTHLRVDGSLG